MKKLKRALGAVLCMGALWGGAVPPAQAAAPEPDVLFFPHLLPTIPPPPDLQDPCGIAQSSTGAIYVSSYYRDSVYRYSGIPGGLQLQIPTAEPLSGPCGLAVDSIGRLYVNNYHRNVERYPPSGGGFGTPNVIDSSHPTGVAVNSATNEVYVNARTHLKVYDSTGAPVMDGPDPLRIGQGSLVDGYGLAVSAHSTTVGRVYVPDYADDTVKVYDPTVDEDDSVQVITGPPGGFGSLRDSAVAVDRVTGEIYVADTLAYPQYTEKPETTIYVFEANGAYKGRLKYNVIDGSPVGLGVDNTLGASQSRVYVTSGNTIEAGVYAYPPGSATSESAPPLSPFGKVEGTADDGPIAAPRAGTEGIGGVSRLISASPSVISQKGTLRVSVSGKLAPKRLPRNGAAPISVTVGGQISTTDKSLPPQLESMRIELNREGKLDSTGLPPCNYNRIQPGSSQRALSACRSSLVGEGSFTANITLAGQEPYPTKGKLLVFHSVEKGKPVLYGHIYSAKPFATSFVIVFAIQDLGKGTYGTALNAPLPAAMDAWGRLTGLEMTLSRRYTYKGKQRSFISAGCPAPKGFPGAVFPLTKTEFTFGDGRKLSSVLNSECKARG